MSNLLTVHQNLPALPVDATSDEVRKNLMDMFRDRQAFSEHTWKMLLSVCRSWAAWCKLNNRKWFPAEPEDVRDYLLYLQARGLAVKTIQQHLGQLNMLHRRSGLPRPSDSNAVSLVMRRIRKENVDAGERAKQALAFERTDFDQVRSLMENSDRCQDIRNLAFLGIAYNTLLRIAEIARIRVKDISRTDGGRMLIHIGRTKTLVSTAGVEKALSLGVTKLVERWISVSGVADDPNNYLFCRVRKNGVAAPSATSQLSTRALEGIFEATHRLIYGAKDDSGQRYLAWSGHSARVGAARDMARAGVSIPEIMQAGGWTNVNIVMNYIRNLDSETGAMVRLLEDGDKGGRADPAFLYKVVDNSMASEARKTKKKIKGIQQATAGVSQDTSENPNKTIVPAALPQLTPTLVSLLEVIEPEVLYAGYDSSVPDSAWRIMTTLNMLGGRQVIAAVKWAKAIPGFRNLHLDDQMTLLQYSWMFLMAFALGWRSYRQSSGNLLCFAPDLIINEQRMSLPCMYDQCKHMLFVSSELQRLQVSYEEYLCMKTLLLLSSVPKEGLKSQELFDEIRMTYIKELGKAIVKREGNSSQNWQRFYQLTKLLDSMHEVVENLLTYCFQTFLDKTMSIEFPEMLAEIITNQIPKYSNGNIKKLLFHQK
nr:Cre recombinase fused to ligand binding domain of the glucocorticoid receptor [Cloning vector pMpGWB337]BBD34375.1 Cre recombinase fused to ligand binding domain of the glucocorticoid receptor [Binary vector pMpGWB337tdTN]BBD34380.1 Cre recombinase fused to ligand binding domain of the glucocorticoid receptor [Binary vector pMpGWB337Cit]BBD34385.1 Cre recombinase fused to ligand binding domain of the glucocorticoid receptor [Binary vector pMpGWB337tdT]BBD34390.1 Cre recombinase fused to liga